jgi:prepilin-type N-terminal cleavage/methylation domain-containing protein
VARALPFTVPRRLPPEETASLGNSLFQEHNMVRNRSKGFTLIELLIVVVIIGILAAIAIPKFANTKEKAYLAAMKSDLRNLATYEESYAADNAGAYFGGPASGPMTNPVAAAVTLNGFTPSANDAVVAVTVPAAPPLPAGWTATAAMGTLTAKTCISSLEGLITCS